MVVRQRCNPAELKKIAEEAKQVSIKKGIATEKQEPRTVQEGGAFASMKNRMNMMNAAGSRIEIPDSIRQVFSPQASAVPQTTQVQTSVTEQASTNIRPGMLYSRIYESVETVGQTKEYFNATSSLLTLYALGQLNESVLRTLSKEDLQEIKGIVREFQGILETF